MKLSNTKAKKRELKEEIRKSQKKAKNHKLAKQPKHKKKLNSKRSLKLSEPIFNFDTVLKER
jgi:hypothetical protein